MVVRYESLQVASELCMVLTSHGEVLLQRTSNAKRSSTNLSQISEKRNNSQVKRTCQAKSRASCAMLNNGNQMPFLVQEGSNCSRTTTRISITCMQSAAAAHVGTQMSRQALLSRFSYPGASGGRCERAR